jgi:sugar phosphate isomerase/epimerase
MTRIALGFNCNCFTNRYDESEEWTGICSDLGIREVMFSIDLIDPYWPWELQKKLADRVLESCARRGIRIRASFGGHHGHQHYLGHPDPECRREAESFLRRAIRQTAYLGGTSFGTCFAIMTKRSDDSPKVRKGIIDDALAAYQRLAEYAAEQGLQAIAYESTSVSRESCADFAENDRVLEAGARFAIPIRVCLDLGHRNRGGLPEEADHLAWIRRYGTRCDVIDCQQTDLESSRHWPFDEASNRKGVIRGDEVVAAIRDSGAADILLAFEIKVPAFYPQERGFRDALEASVRYWRQWVED